MTACIEPASRAAEWLGHGLPVSRRRTVHEARDTRAVGEANHRWAAFVTAARDEAARQWQAGDKRGALRTLCGAGVFQLASVSGQFGLRAVRAVAWHRSGAVRPTRRYSEKQSVKVGEVRMGWHEPTVRLMLSQGAI